MLVLVHVQYCGVYDLDRQVIRQMLELKLLEPLESIALAPQKVSEKISWRLISYYSRTK